jgi:hypothetical protein
MAVRLLLSAAIALLAAGCTPPVASNVIVDRFEARMVVDPRGSAEVEETWVLTPTGAGDAWFRRVVPGGRHDGLQQVDATLSNRPVDRDANGAVTWRLAAGGGPQTARLRYTVTGVVEVSGGRGKVTWRALEGSAALIADARLSLILPGVMVVVDPPLVTEPGWQVSHIGQEVVAQRTSLAAGDSATLVAGLSIDAGTLPRPTWQEYKERATFLVPAFLSAGLFIVVVGLGIVAMVVAQRKTWTAADRGGVVRSLFIAGAVSLVLSALLALIMPALVGHYGASPFAIPAGIAVVGVMLAATAWVLRLRAVAHLSSP